MQGDLLLVCNTYNNLMIYPYISGMYHYTLHYFIVKCKAFSVHNFLCSRWNVLMQSKVFLTTSRIKLGNNKGSIIVICYL